jgi:hypothetical protein
MKDGKTTTVDKNIGQGGRTMQLIVIGFACATGWMAAETAKRPKESAAGLITVLLASAWYIPGIILTLQEFA